MGSNRGGHVKHAPGHICYAKGNPNKTRAKKGVKAKKIAQGKQAARAREALAGR